jgi:hypothetical protein
MVSGVAADIQGSFSVCSGSPQAVLQASGRHCFRAAGLVASRPGIGQQRKDETR